MGFSPQVAGDRGLMTWCWHQWDKWETYQVQINGTMFHRNPWTGEVKPPHDKSVVLHNREKRNCQKCGKLQDRYVSTVVPSHV